VRFTEILGPFNFLFDASYGSSTYSTMDPEYVYKVYQTNTGIITRVEKRAAPISQNTSTLSIEINKACGEQPSFWRALALWVNEKLSARPS